MALNRDKFVELIKRPEKMSAADYAELEKLLSANPYFQSGFTLLAKGSRDLKKKSAPRVMQRAAIYATDRAIFKNYLLKKQTSQPSPKTAAAQPQSQPDRLSGSPITQPKGNQDQVINEIYENLAQWDQHRDEYLEWDKAHPEDIVILPAEPLQDEPTQKEPETIDAVEKLKSQVAKEVQEEEVVADEIKAPEVSTEAEPPTLEVKEPDPIQEKPKHKAVSEASKEIKEEDNYAQEKAEEFEKAKSVSFDIISDAASLVDPHHKDKIEAESTPEQTEAMKHQQEELEQQMAEEVTETNEKETESSAKEDVVMEEPSQPVEEIPETENIEVEVAQTESETVAEEEAPKIESELPEIEPETEPVSEEPITEPESAEEKLISTEELSEIVDKESTPAIQDEMTGEKFSEDELVQFEHKIDEDTGQIMPMADKTENKTEVTSEPVKQEPEAEDPESVAEEPTKEVEEQASVAEDKSEEETPKPKSDPVHKVQEEIPTNIDDAKELEVDLHLADDDRSTEETEAELDRLDHEKQELKLTFGHAKERKFRLSVMKRSIQFTREKPEKKEKKLAPTRENKEATSEDEKPTAKKETKKSTKPTAKKTKAKKEPAKKTKKGNDESSQDDVKKKALTNKDKNDHQSLIDQFIAAEPSISAVKPSKNNDPVEDLSVSQETFPEEVVTENLASILAEQGKTEKAIIMYEKLILKSPEKKTYFASQIEKLKKK